MESTALLTYRRATPDSRKGKLGGIRGRKASGPDRAAQLPKGSTMRAFTLLLSSFLLFSMSARAEIGVYNDAAEFSRVANMDVPLTFERTFEDGTFVGDMYLTSTTAPGGVAGVWSENGTQVISSEYYFIWRDYSEAGDGFIYGALWNVGVEPTTYLQVVPREGSTAVSLNLTGFYVGESCDVMRIEVETADGALYEFTHSSKASPGAWNLPSGNGFLGIVADVPIQSVRINIVESTTQYTYDVLILDNVAAGVLVDPSAVGHTPSEFHGCNPDTYPFAGPNDDPISVALGQCEADLLEGQSVLRSCEQDLASARSEVIVQYVEVPVEVVKIVEVERLVDTCKSLDSETKNRLAGRSARRSRSGLGDGSNPGRGEGRTRSPQRGEDNPSAR